MIDEESKRSTRDERIRAALDVRALDRYESQELEFTEDVDGVPNTIEGSFRQIVVYSPEAFGVAGEDVEAAALLEAAMTEMETE